MDIAGAKALKERLGLNGAHDASPPPADVDVPEDAPPVYHWLGVEQAKGENPSAEGDDESAAPGASLFRRLGLSLR